MTMLLGPDDFDVEVLTDGLGWGEGPVLAERYGGVLFTDIPANRVLLWRDGLGVEEFNDASNHANGQTCDAQGRIIVCEHAMRRVIRIETDGSVSIIADAFNGRRLNSPNDVVVAKDGAIWFTDPRYGLLQGHCPAGEMAEQPLDGVYRADPETGEVTLKIDCLDKPNGLAFSRDGQTLYVGDSGLSERPDGNHHIFKFSVDEGLLRPVSVFAEIAPGMPDGMRVDASGTLWTSAGDGIRAYAPDGDMAAHIALGEATTNLCLLPDTDGSRQIFVTTPTRALRITFAPVNDKPDFGRF